MQIVQYTAVARAQTQLIWLLLDTVTEGINVRKLSYKRIGSLLHQLQHLGFRVAPQLHCVRQEGRITSGPTSIAHLFHDSCTLLQCMSPVSQLASQAANAPFCCCCSSKYVVGCPNMQSCVKHCAPGMFMCTRHSAPKGHCVAWHC